MRRANGILAAAVTAFFFAHAALGAASLHLEIPSALSWLVWFGAAIIAAHVVASCATSRSMLVDRQRPPSPRKKRHLALKWATGVLLLALAVAHGAGVSQGTAARVLAAVLVVALAAHVCIGAKSLLKDLGIARSRRAVFRAVVICVAAVVCLALLVP